MRETQRRKLVTDTKPAQVYRTDEDIALEASAKMRLLEIDAKVRLGPSLIYRIGLVLIKLAKPDDLRRAMKALAQKED